MSNPQSSPSSPSPAPGSQTTDMSASSNVESLLQRIVLSVADTANRVADIADRITAVESQLQAQTGSASTAGGSTTPPSGPSALPNQGTPEESSPFGLRVARTDLHPSRGNERRQSIGGGHSVPLDSGRLNIGSNNPYDTVLAHMTVPIWDIKPLSSLNPEDVFIFMLSRILFVQINARALSQLNAQTGLYAYLAPNLQEALRTKFPDLEHKEGPFLRGFPGLEDEVIINCLLRIQPPQTKADFVEVLFSFLANNTFNSKIKYDPAKANYADMHLETLRVIGRFKKFFEMMYDAVSNDSDKLPDMNQQYDLPSKLVAVYSATMRDSTKKLPEQALFHRVVLTCLVPGFKDIIEEKIGTRTLKNMTVLSMLSEFSKKSEEANLSLKSAQSWNSALNKGVSRNSHGGNLNHLNMHENDIELEPVLNLDYNERRHAIPDDLFANMQQSSKHNSMSSNSLTPRYQPRPALGQQNQNWRDNRAQQPIQAAKLASNGRAGTCVATKAIMRVDGAYDPQKHTAANCPNSKNGNPCPWDHSRQGYMDENAAMYKVLKAAVMNKHGLNSLDGVGNDERLTATEWALRVSLQEQVDLFEPAEEDQA